MVSQIVRQTPSLVLGSVDDNLERRMGMISTRIFSPNLRQTSAVVRLAVFDAIRLSPLIKKVPTCLYLFKFRARYQEDDLAHELRKNFTNYMQMVSSVQIPSSCLPHLSEGCLKPTLSICVWTKCGQH